MSLATSYARALYEAAKDAGGTADSLDQLEAQMDSFLLGLKGAPEAQKALLGPVISIKEKEAIIASVAQAAGYSRLLINFFSLLLSKDRLSAFSEIREAFSVVRLDEEGGVAGRLVSADPLSDADVQSLSASFTKKLGKKVAFRSSTDASLLAGVKVIVNGVTYDGTLRAQIKKLRDQIIVGTAARS